MANYKQLFTQAESGEVNFIEVQPICSSFEGCISKNLVKAVDALNEKVSQIDAKNGAVLERLLTEVIALRKENSTLRSNLRPASADKIVPNTPYKEKDLFLDFEKDLADSSEKQQKLVAELQELNIANVDKYIRTCWRKFITDDVAEHFSWRGTGVKISAIGLATTAAIRSAFRNKFNSEEEVFSTISKKHFQYAHDRQTKLAAYRRNKN